MRTKADRRTALLFVAIPVVFFFAISMYWGWNGGTAAGPRYLMEVVPFLCLPVIFVLDRLTGNMARLAVYALLALSAFNVWAETVGGRAFPAGPIKDPLFTYSLPQLAHGHVPLNLGFFLGMSGAASLLPLAFLLTGWSLANLNSRRRTAEWVRPAPQTA
jgi:hypothetical protein